MHRLGGKRGISGKQGAKDTWAFPGSGPNESAIEGGQKTQVPVKAVNPQRVILNEQLLCTPSLNFPVCHMACFPLAHNLGSCKALMRQEQ